jgi:regulator of sigma E protease
MGFLHWVEGGWPALQNFGWLVVLIGVMILIHEFGHFLMARFFDVRVETFSFGFGPRLLGFRRGDTDYRVSALFFLGGYVKMAGEQPGDENADDPRSFMAKPRWQRLAIAFAGPAMNIVLAVSLMTGLFMVRFQRPPQPAKEGMIGQVIAGSAAAKAGIHEGDQIVRIDDKANPTWDDIFMKEIASANHPLAVVIERSGKLIYTTVTPELEKHNGIGVAGWAEQTQIEIANVAQGMPAEKAGLKTGDIVVSLNGQPIRSGFKLREIIRRSEGRPVDVEVLREGRQIRVSIAPVLAKDPTDGQSYWMVGVGPRPLTITTSLALPEAFRESIRQNLKGGTLIFQFLAGIVERKLSPKSIDGPIRIAQLSGEAAREGPAAFIGLMCVVSLNLAIFNLLPIPVLDGGMIFLLLVEMFIRRDLSLQVKETVLKLGFVFLMMIVVFVLYNDLSKMAG